MSLTSTESAHTSDNDADDELGTSPFNRLASVTIGNDYVNVNNALIIFQSELSAVIARVECNKERHHWTSPFMQEEVS